MLNHYKCLTLLGLIINTYLCAVQVTFVNKTNNAGGVSNFYKNPGKFLQLIPLAQDASNTVELKQGTDPQYASFFFTGQSNGKTAKSQDIYVKDLRDGDTITFLPTVMGPSGALRFKHEITHAGKEPQKMLGEEPLSD